MEPLQNDSVLTVLTVAVTLNTFLSGVVGFFLKNLYSRFERIEVDLRTSMISGASENQRIIQIENNLNDLKRIVMSKLFPIN